MALELQREVLELLAQIHGGSLRPTPDWLMRPGKVDCRRRWPLVQRMYHDLTGLDLPEDMPPRERRQVDLVLQKRGQQPRIIEVDERQHFNCYRTQTLRLYPRSVRLGFPKHVWVSRSEAKRRLEGGGFGKAKPPLFPGDGGRHRQRAFRDALADVLPLAYGWSSTLPIADFEVEGWLYAPGAQSRMRQIIASRL